MTDQVVQSVYFSKAGPENTQRTLELARARAEELGLRHVVLPSNTGKTGLLAAEVFAGYHLTVVTHSTGFSGPNQQEFLPENRARLAELGANVLTCQHALGGIGRAVRRKLGTYQIDEIIAYTLRTFCQGIKVACELTVKSADAGLVPAGEPIIAMGGTGRGVDAAAVIVAANAQDFFDLRVLEIICKPRCWS